MTLLLQSVPDPRPVAVAAYGVWEVRRWGTPAGRSSLPAPAPHPCLGPILSASRPRPLAPGDSLPLPTPHTRRAPPTTSPTGSCVALAALPLIPLALLDARENLRRALEDRRRLRDSLLAPREGQP